MTFHGIWHQQGDQVIFDTIEPEPPIILKHVSRRVDDAKRAGNENGGARATTTALFGPGKRWLANAMESWEVWFLFEDGDTAGALIKPSEFKAIAPRTGKLHGIKVGGAPGDGGGEWTVPIPPDVADAEIFTLAVRRVAFVTTGSSEPPPPMTITEDGLLFDGSLIFIKEAP